MIRSQRHRLARVDEKALTMPKEIANGHEETSQHEPAHSDRMIRILLIDYNGIRRCKVVPLSLLSRNVRYIRCGLSLQPWYELPSGALEGATGEVTMLPPSQVKKAPRRIPIPWTKNHDYVLAELYDGEESFCQCPRAALLRAIELLSGLGLSGRAGFELEFLLFHGEGVESGNVKPFGGLRNHALHCLLDMASPVLDDMVDTLGRMGITVQLYHVEAGEGQYELVLAHKPLLEAVEDVIVAREAVRAVARRHGLYATFMPRYGEYAMTGSHVHVSLEGHFETEDVVHGMRVGMSKTAQSFMGGIVEGLPWLAFLLNASVLSYSRTKEGAHVGVHKVWGISNRDVPVRVAEDRSNFEVKLLDGVSNVYLAMAGIILAGVKGVRKGCVLDEPWQIDPSSVSGERVERLPRSLKESLEEFERNCDKEMYEVFSSEMVHDLVVVKRGEMDYVAEKGMAEYEKLLLQYH